MAADPTEAGRQADGGRVADPMAAGRRVDGDRVADPMAADLPADGDQAADSTAWLPFEGNLSRMSLSALPPASQGQGKLLWRRPADQAEGFDRSQYMCGPASADPDIHHKSGFPHNP